MAIIGCRVNFTGHPECSGRAMNEKRRSASDDELPAMASGAVRVDVSQPHIGPSDSVPYESLTPLTAMEEPSFPRIQGG